MTPDELRALADALLPMAAAPCFDGIDVERAAAYLRAQADARPVAWIARNLTTGRVKWTTDRCRARGWTRDANLRVRLLYAHPAPAVPQLADRCRSSETLDPKATGRSSPERPASNREDAAAMVAAGSGEQAEPTGPHMIVAEDRFPDVPAERWKPCPQCGEDFDRECPICDGLGRVLATDSEQAEPKREPLTYEQLVSACYTYRHDFGLLDPDEQELVIEEAGRWAKAFGIGGSDER